MASLALAFDILARDKASKEFKNVGEAAEGAGKKAGKFSGAMKAGMAVAGVAVVGFGKQAIGSASDLSETLSKNKAIFGENAAEIEKWAGSAATNFGLSKSAALEAASGFGNMFQQLGFTGDAAADNSKNIVQMAADLGSFNNVDPTEVLEKIGGALRGEFDSLQALIPNINAARVEQEAMAATGKKVAKELTAQEKATATLAIIQKDGATAAGDFAKTSGGLANQQRILKARFEDVSAQVGTKLLPLVTDLLGRFVSMIEFVKRNQKVIVPLVAVLGGLAAAVWAVNAAAKAYTVVQAALNVVLAANPIGLVVLALVALGTGLVLAYKHSETFRDVVNGVFRAVAGFVVGAVDNVLGALEGIFRAASNIPGIGGKFKGVADKIAGARDKVQSLNDKVDAFGRKKVTASLKLMGVGAAEEALVRLEQRMTNIGGVQVMRPVGATTTTRSGGAQARANGGPVTAGRPYLVGERGPELIVPRAAGHVMTAGQTRGALGGLTFRDIIVQSGPSEDASQSLPRTLRNLAFTMGV